MVEAVPESSGEKKFLTFLINYVVETGDGDLQTNLTHLTKHMQDNLAAQSEENLYRKQFGNLKQCVESGPLIMSVFKMQGTCFKFQAWENVVAANEAGNLEPAAWAKAQEGYAAFQAKRGQ